jgi:hypothetical protein
MEKIIVMVFFVIQASLVMADNAHIQAYGENVPPVVESVVVTPYTFNSENSSGTITVTVTDLNGADDLKIGGQYIINIFVTNEGNLGYNLMNTRWCSILKFSGDSCGFFDDCGFFTGGLFSSIKCFPGLADCCKMELSEGDVTVLNETSVIFEFEIAFLEDCKQGDEYFAEVIAWDRHGTFGSWLNYSSPKPDFEYEKLFAGFTATGQACFMEEREWCWFGYCHTYKIRKCYPATLTVEEDNIILETGVRTVTWDMESYWDYFWSTVYIGKNDEWGYFRVYASQYYSYVSGYGPDVVFTGRK